jgi:hypothetical protein
MGHIGQHVEPPPHRFGAPSASSNSASRVPSSNVDRERVAISDDVDAVVDDSWMDRV